MTREQILKKISSYNLIIDTAEKGILYALELKDTNKVDSFENKKAMYKEKINKLYDELQRIRNKST